MQFSNTGIHVAEQTVRETDFLADNTVSVMFPRVYTIDGDEDIPIFPGVVLQSRKPQQQVERLSRWKLRRDHMGELPSGESYLLHAQPSRGFLLSQDLF